MLKFTPATRAHALPLCFCFVVLTCLTSAFGQSSVPDFFLQATAASPSSVNPGVPSTSTITVGTLNGFNSSVDLACQITPVQQTSPPLCRVSPSPVVPPGQGLLTITTSNTTPPALYTVTVTGTSGATTHQVQVDFSVLAVTPAYTVTATALTPSSVHAGSGATATVTVTPSNGYSGSVTLSCSAISPTATPAPTCAFNPQTVAVTSGKSETSTLTISTTGAHAARSLKEVFYAVWLPLPGLALIALRMKPSGRRPGKVACLSILFLVAAGLLLMAGCGSSGSTTTSTTATPNNSYTFTLSATDANSLAPSNGNQTVSLTVN